MRIPQKYLQTDVYNNFSHNCQNLEVTKMPFSRRWINKLWHIQSMQYYLVLKRDEMSSHQETGGSVVRNPPANLETWVQRSGRSPGVEDGNPYQYSCPEDPID